MAREEVSIWWGGEETNSVPFAWRKWKLLEVKVIVAEDKVDDLCDIL